MERANQRCLASAAWSAVAGCRWLSASGAVVGCCMLVSVAAQVRIPLPNTDVPMTLQSLAVLLTGLVLSPSRAVGALVLYLTCGTLGLGVFAGGSAGLVGPTGGYLVGFVVAVWVVSVLKGSGDARVLRMVAASAGGMLVLFAVGVGWRIVWLSGDIRLAILTGLVPFAVKASVQVLLAPTLVATTRRLLGRRG